MKGIREITLSLKPGVCPFCGGRIFDEKYSLFCLNCFAQVIAHKGYYIVRKKD